MNKFMSPVPLLPQHASRTPGLSPRPTPVGKDRTPPKPVRPLGRSPFPEGRRTERKARFPSRASTERHARSARADARYRPTTVLCASALTSSSAAKHSRGCSVFPRPFGCGQGLLWVPLCPLCASVVNLSSDSVDSLPRRPKPWFRLNWVGCRSYTHPMNRREVMAGYLRAG